VRRHVQLGRQGVFDGVLRRRQQRQQLLPAEVGQEPQGAAVGGGLRPQERAGRPAAGRQRDELHGNADAGPVAVRRVLGDVHVQLPADRVHQRQRGGPYGPVQRGGVPGGRDLHRGGVPPVSGTQRKGREPCGGSPKGAWAARRRVRTTEVEGEEEDEASCGARRCTGRRRLRLRTRRSVRAGRSPRRPAALPCQDQRWG